MSQQRTTNILGWIVFAISLLIYILSLEPTASFWDCTEFIACAGKLEIGHAPGAPLFMLLGRFFALFAGGDQTKVAYMINLLSATASAATIMFLFWTILWFGKKIGKAVANETTPTILYISAFIGAITFAVTDSFWFSAVEGEVYATSSLFTAAVFWTILRWEREEDSSKANRWIILMFYLVGLSVGVHLLNILAFPAMAMVYYFKNYKPTRKGIITTFIISSILLVFLIFILVPGVARFAALFDLMFVNGFGLPVYSGAITFIILLSAGIVFLLKYARKHKKKILYLAALSFTVWMMGYSTFTVLIIRSNANPYVDMNDVENIFGLVDYLNREQYPKRPLIYGNNYNSPIVGSKDRFTYKMYDGKYMKDELNPKYSYDKKTLTVFPRMASSDKSHESAYRQWVDIEGRPVKVRNNQGEMEVINVPTLGENIQFFFRYQLGHMYFRYFMWNFAGRQNNRQGFGDILEGNWISGIKFIDEARLGNQENFPTRYVDNPGRNRYYFLPLLLGLVGVFFHYKKDKNNFFVNTLFFLLTGIAIVVYLNEIPVTPRERDYVHVGSFYAFSIWIGLGSMAILDFVRRKLPKVAVVQYVVAGIIFFLVPLHMLGENWDDHDRSGRGTARDYAWNMLNSCSENGILFTTADNDTYPLWYAQEIEEYRRDVRTVITMFMPVGWYVDQFHNDYPGEGVIPVSFTGQDFLRGERYFAPFMERIKEPIDLKEAIQFFASDNKQTKVAYSQGELIDYLPSKQFKVKVNKENVLNNCKNYDIIPDSIPDEMVFKINKNHLVRDEILLLDIIANNDWERPIFVVNPTVVSKIGLADYLHRQGMVYQLLPFKAKDAARVGYSNAEFQYDLLKNTFRWGGVNHPDVKLDWTNVRMISSMRFRSMFADAAKALLKEDKKEKALEMLEMGIELFPVEKIPYSFFFTEIIEAYYLAGDKEKGDELSQQYLDVIQKDFAYFNSIDPEYKPSINQELRSTLYMMQRLVEVTAKHSKELHEGIYEEFSKYYQNLMRG